ncbi:MAG: helix-turn-helix domain-containing protein [Kofleriaceae bacterium]
MTRTRLAKRAPETSVGDLHAQPSVANDQIAAIAESREFTERIAAEVFRGVVAAIQGVLRGDAVTGAASATEASDVMTADEAAAFLGVDRTTVYDFAGRGVIPHQRLGKRLLFRRGTLVSWLDSSLCKATSTRKA